MPNYNRGNKNHMVKKDPLTRIKRKTVIDPITGCWLFTGSKNKGHGQIFMGEGLRPERVHRISAQHYLDYDLTSSLQVNHKCANRNCWNPDHLYVGTQQQNVGDSMIAGTHANQHGPTWLFQK